ncbi:hypothetical protein ACLOJK_007946 [Asimina triloba]
MPRGWIYGTVGPLKIPNAIPSRFVVLLLLNSVFSEHGQCERRRNGIQIPPTKLTEEEGIDMEIEMEVEMEMEMEMEGRKKKAASAGARKVEMYHVIHKVPAGDSPYVRAKHLQIQVVSTFSRCFSAKNVGIHEPSGAISVGERGEMVVWKRAWLPGETRAEEAFLISSRTPSLFLSLVTM